MGSNDAGGIRIMKKIKIGFLPLYIKLYDDCGSGAAARPRLEPFYERLACELEKRGFDVLRSSFCRTDDEFRSVVSHFKSEGAGVIVTWHAAYSPSLESIGALRDAGLPVVMLDTTETFDFSSTQNPGEISYCHGIHGVMDLSNLLLRSHIPFAVAAGHIEHSDVLDRAAGYIRAAAAAHSMLGSRTASVGGCFDGMGDFLISDREMRDIFGVEMIYPDGDELDSIRNSLTDEETEAEIARLSSLGTELEAVPQSAYADTARNSLALRHWLSDNRIDAFTVNFREIRPGCGLELMPFTEACYQMSRGTGYAGEGDALTASLVGALMKSYPDTSFVEIFCPDWKNNSILLSHMGEYNPRMTEGRGTVKAIDFIYGEAKDPVVVYDCYCGGSAVYVNLSRGADEKFKMILSPVTLLDIPAEQDNFKAKVRGWMRHDKLDTASFLEALGKRGAIHHSALVKGSSLGEMQFFAEVMGLPVEIV